jgi:putative transcriptional regulator
MDPKVDLKVTPGTLLAAMPDLMDGNFMHAVVLLCHHAEDGAYGLVVNRASGLTTKQVLSDHPQLGRAGFPIFLGGPVDHSTLQFLHALPDEIPGGLPLAGGLWLGGELAALARYVAAHPRRARTRIRMFLGYSGWGGGQLERELAGGSWLPAPLALDAVFARDFDLTWRRVVRSTGKATGTLENLPPDVSWN